MTELEQARKHLREVQCDLAFVRAHSGFERGIRRGEDEVLAALSRVWEAQEAERLVWETRKYCNGFVVARVPQGREPRATPVCHG